MHTQSIKQIISHTIESNHLFSKNEKILVALSGGIDSVVLTYILHTLGYSIAIAHCNFHLRGEESNRDEEFVQNFAKTHNLMLHCTEFNTEEYAKSHSLSIEMAARELRYAWFNELCAQYNYSKIVVAHNANDSIETFFINLLRGTGIKGLQGIPLQNGNIVRPMLSVWRNEIESYATQTGLDFCFDSTNATLDFVRNNIRLTILPELQKINAHAPQAIFNTIENLNKYYTLSQPYIDTLCEQLCKETPYGMCIDETAVQQHEFPENVLYEILNRYGFNAAQVQQIFTCFSQQAGKQFFSPTHAAFHDRNVLYIVPQETSQNFPTEIILNELPQQSVIIPQGELKFGFGSAQPPTSVVERRLLSGAEVSRNDILEITFTQNQLSTTAQFNTEKLQFPLTLRPWKAGDRIRLQGIKGSKKVSDVLIDAKVPRHYKNKVWVMESADEIVWVIGYRQV
ncbi:MAG: tRNA lysidine(34) synthetase TilS [Bacteroidetes bacterium]|nr:tRNA lysidine(34) synthetase TilS [Bacteroidota bacterium]